MIWLPLAALESFGFGQLFKWAQRRGCYPPMVVAVNYLVLSAILAAYLLASGRLQLSAGVLQVGAATGSAFILSMLVMTRALEIADVAAVLTAFRLAILAPIAASIWLWGETVSPLQIGGIGLAITALALMTRKGNHRAIHSGLAGSGLIFLVFACQGLSQCCLRWVHYAGLDQDRLSVLLVTATTAGILGSAVVVLKKRPGDRQDLLMGAGIGVYNLVALAILLTALALIPGTTFFPVHGCAVVVMDNLFAHFFWKEPLSRTAAIGATLGALSMLLVL